MEEEGLDAAGLELGQLVADDLGQHLGELHAQRLVDEGVEAEVEQAAYHLRTHTHTHIQTGGCVSDVCVGVLPYGCHEYR